MIAIITRKKKLSNMTDVWIRLSICPRSPFVLNNAVYLVTPEPIPKLATLAVEEIDNTIAQTPMRSAPRLINKNLYKK